MTKLYQVFISSTYEDLREERRQIMQALLECDCIPSGMEFFPAADPDPLSFIKPVIDECDYYIVVIGARYGSVGTGGKSFTQLEYEYAHAAQKPVLAFLHGHPERLPQKKTEPREDHKSKLVQFRKQLMAAHTFKYWNSPQELRSVVADSMRKTIRHKPAAGWIRSNVPSKARSFHRDNNHVYRMLSDETEGRNTRRAWLVQFSGRNVISVLQCLWRSSDAEINLYVLNPESPYIVADQAARIRRFETDLPRELAETNTQAVFKYWEYDVPASVRVVLLDDALIAFGPYLYKARDPRANATMDVFGGEVPIMLVRNGDPDFEVVRVMTESLIGNWLSAGLCREKWSMDEEQRRVRERQNRQSKIESGI